MKKRHVKLLFLCLFLYSGIKTAAQNSPMPFFDSAGIVAPGAQPVKMSDQFVFTEGPVADRKGDVYFTDQPNNNIWLYETATKQFTLFKRDAGRANGLEIDKKGYIIACADENNELWSISPKGDVKVLLGKVDDKKLNGPNDLWIDKKGGIYFTDPYYQRDYWDRKEPEIKEQKVYYLPAGAKQPIGVTADLVQPNGITGSADGRHLFVADLGGRKTYKYTIGKKGRLSGKTLVAPEGSDGITLDEQGNLYLTGNGVTVYDTSRKKIAYISVPEKWTANLCFAGAGRELLFITAGTSVYTLQMNVKGMKK